MKASAFTKTYGTRRVLDMPEMSFEKGLIYAVIGANGSGKTTYARILSGAEPADRRQIRGSRPREKPDIYRSTPTLFTCQRWPIFAWQAMMTSGHTG